MSKHAAISYAAKILFKPTRLSRRLLRRYRKLGQNDFINECLRLRDQSKIST